MTRPPVVLSEAKDLHSISRRDALKAGGLLLGGALIVSSGLLTACGGGEKPRVAQQNAGVLSPDDQSLMTEIADTILPDTPSSPGAKAAGASAAIQLLLTDCYVPAAQQRVVRGLGDFRASCRAQKGADFTALPRPAREQLLRELDAEARKTPDTHWFALARELSERAYFSSEIGMTKALRYVRVPGHFTGCMPLEKGQHAWG
ncbi:MAG TPA: gluconate 2-dehydrogenase subunit 3 family protein [Gemmatimonadaceae bacterium]|nr:gluconate 2-dehydrogenase subunit 3 family protein [Gemmatimonadaceae bacterium]